MVLIQSCFVSLKGKVTNIKVEFWKCVRGSTLSLINCSSKRPVHYHPTIWSIKSDNSPKTHPHSLLPSENHPCPLNSKKASSFKDKLWAQFQKLAKRRCKKPKARTWGHYLTRCIPKILRLKGKCLFFLLKFFCLHRLFQKNRILIRSWSQSLWFWSIYQACVCGSPNTDHDLFSLYRSTFVCMYLFSS